MKPPARFGAFRHIFGFCAKILYSIATLIDARPRGHHLRFQRQQFDLIKLILNFMTELVKVGSESKYIDLMVDWSFKKIFGTEVNKDILIEFLKVIFPQYAISDITYVPTEQLGIMEDDRKAIFDVLCRTEDGKTFLVEMQRGYQKHFFERALFYTSFPIMKQGKKALAEEAKGNRPWDFCLDGVFFLGILNFKYEDDEMTEHRYRLLEATSKKLMTDKLEFVFVEVEKFDKGEDELETDLDKWLYLLKNMSNLLKRPERLRDRIFTKLFDVAELAQLDDKDRTNYIKAMNTERDTYNQIEYARETGREEGREEGLKEGQSKIAINLIRLGASCEIIVQATGLSEEEVSRLKKELSNA